MKILRLNEHTSIEKDIEITYNNTKYTFMQISPTGYNLGTSTSKDAKSAIEMYDNVIHQDKTKLQRKNQNFYIITEQTSRVLSKEEIDLLRQASKYNL